MQIQSNHMLGAALAGACVALIFDGVRRVRRGGDAMAMVLALAEIAIPASFLLGYGLALSGVKAPMRPSSAAQAGDR